MHRKRFLMLLLIAAAVCLLTACKKKLPESADDVNTSISAVNNSVINDEGESSVILPDEKPDEYREQENVFADISGEEENITHLSSEKTRSSGRLKEIEDGKADWKEMFPAATVIWFEIDCHDGREHIYYATNGMPMETWIGSRYNVDKWQRSGRNIVDSDCTLCLVTDGYDPLTYALTEGLKFDTEFFTADLIYEETPEVRTGEAMLQYIENLDIGVAVEDSSIIVTDIDEALKVASKTVYSYEEGALQSIITTYYCEDSICDSYEAYLNGLGIYSSVVRAGNSFRCTMPEEYVAQYLDFERAAMRQILVDRFNFEHSF